MNNLLNINKTKYRYLMDNLDLSKNRTIMTYTIPVPKGEEKPTDEFFNRDYPDVGISNAKFVENIDKVANALKAFGVKKGDIVTICQTNTPEMFYMDYALNKIGAQPNFIYPNVTADEMKYFIDELNSRYLFILDDEPIRKNVKLATDGTGIKVISSTVIEAFPTLFKIIASKKAPKSVTPIENEVKWADFIKLGKKIKAEECEYVPNTVCGYVHTSGTSSVPKAVMYSNENVNGVSCNYEIDKIEYDVNTCCIETIPQFVSYGITTNHMLFSRGLNIVMIPEMEPKNCYDLVKKYSPEYAFTTPSHIREMIKRPVDLSNARHFTLGGDGFDDVELVANEYFLKNGSLSLPYQGYGSTEMSAATIYNTPKLHKNGSLGTLSGNTKAVIIEPGTFNEITEPNKIGELCLTGPGLTLGYAGNSKEETEKVYIKHPDGLTYVHMGDYISRDEEGFFFYHGRIKNVITRKSFTFSPDEIVKAISKHENVRQCIVVPKYSKDEGETPSAHITLNDYSEKEKTMREIIELVNANVTEFHRPTDYKIRTEIPRTRNNKNNILSLKAEDAANMMNGVVDAEISSLLDGEYDSELTVVFDTSVNSNAEDIAAKLDEHIRTIASYTKFAVGKIKYNIILDPSRKTERDKTFKVIA